MSNPNKARGTRWESAIRDYASGRGLHAFRAIAQGEGDVGDVHLEGIVCIQAKDDVSFSFSKWVKDVADQRLRAGLPFGVVVAKRRQQPVGQAYAIMSYDTLLEMTYRLKAAEDFLWTVPHAHAAYVNALKDRP